MYETHFGLSDLPFQISPDARFYVDATPHRAALNALLAGLRRGDEFMLLTGDFGTGKTTVARRLLEEVDRERYAVAELPGLRLEGDDVFDRIADAFGMRGLEAHHRLATMMRMLEDIAHAGRQALLVIDEAHVIGLDALRRLRKLTAVRVEGRGVLHVCLAGRVAPAGIDDLARIGRPLAIGATFHLEALDGADTRAYVLHRLRQVGWSGRPAFDKDVTAEIHACCEGNPARINRLCAHILLQLYMQGRDDTSAGIVRAVDTMMRSELEGEPAVVDLPPAPRAGPIEPDTILEPFSRPPLQEEEESSVDIEALMTRPLSPNLPAVRRSDPGMALAPWRPGGAQDDMAGRAPLHRRRWLQAGVAMALFVGGGFTWHALSGRLASPLGGMGVATAAHAGPTVVTGHVAPAAIVTAPTAVTADSAAPASPQRTAVDAAGLAAAAQLAITTSPPAAGHVAPGDAATAPAPAAPRAASTDAPAATPLRVAETPRGAAAGERNRHRPSRARGAEERAPANAGATEDRPADAQAPAALAGACTAAAETLSLCTRTAPAAAAPRETAAPEAPAREAARESPPPEAVPRPAPVQRPCDRTQSVLGLCGGS